MKKIFGGINLTWKKVILFAIFAGIYTAVMAMLPIAIDTSFRDVAISFEVWIFFGIFIIMNSKSAKDSALKCFVFFLISQPLVYIVQDIINHSNLFNTYYRFWVLWTIACIPMGFIGYYMKKDKWWGLLILTPMLLFLGEHYMGFLGEVIYYFPHHILSVLFCIISMIIYPIFIFKDKRIKLTGTIISLIIIITMTFISLANKTTYNTIILVSDKETGVVFDDSYRVYLENNNLGKVYIKYDEGLEDYIVEAEFKKAGKTNLILEDINGEAIIYQINVKRNNYDIVKKTTPKNISYNKIDNWSEDKVTMNVKDISKDKTSAVLVIEDKNDTPISWNTFYFVQKLSEADVWYDLKSNTVVEQLMKVFTPNENGITEINLDWSDLYGQLQKGIYRVVKSKDFIKLYSNSFEIQ